jgi:sugar-specific transcriptional regulator TrmB
MAPSLTEALRALGLTDKQERVLSLLLQSGPTIVATVAKETKLNRTTAYGILKELAEKGLVSSTHKSGATRFQSIAPDVLPAYIERVQKRLEESKKQIEALVPQMKLLRARGRTLPRVQFFEGEEGVRQAYEDTVENNRGKVLRNITGVDAVFKRLGGEWVSYYLKKRSALGIRCENLAPDSEWAHKSKADDGKYLRKTRLLPSRFNFEAELDIYDNKVGIFSYAKENPVAIIIEDETVATMMRQLFDYMQINAEG